jgi:hypothetical protein
MGETNCEVCGLRPSVGVACVPGVPYSAAYCRECLAVNAHPWGILIANTACLDGLEHAASWWVEMVDDTCKHLGRTRETFELEVKAAIADMERDLSATLDGSRL